MSNTQRQSDGVICKVNKEIETNTGAEPIGSDVHRRRDSTWSNMHAFRDKEINKIKCDDQHCSISHIRIARQREAKYSKEKAISGVAQFHRFSLQMWTL